MIMVKWKVFFDYENEEKWINEMEKRGWHLKHYGFARYTFEKGEPGQYIYRLQLLKNAVIHPENAGYLDFLRESGIEVVTHYLRWIYLRRSADLGPFEIFTDVTSKIDNYKMIRNFFMIFGGLNLYFAFLNGFMFQHEAIESHALSAIKGANLSVGMVNLGIALVLTSYVLNLSKKINRLKREQEMHE